MELGTNAQPRQEEEYTDYSCSTAVERLSRDVETILRAWHVDRGSDHHVTASDNGNSGSSNKASVAAATSGGDALLSNVRLIRSDCISWNLTLTTRQKGRSNITIDLELALWDAPGGGGGGSGGGTKKNKKVNNSTNEDIVGDSDYNDSGDCYTSSPIVRSLQRKPFGAMPAHDFLFDNFSTLFGIGQHISLSPIQPDPIPLELMDSVGLSILQRHHGVNVAPWVLASTLSGWLQTSLNVASANCRTCIPVFGVWGQYRPDELVVHTDQDMNITTAWENTGSQCKQKKGIDCRSSFGAGSVGGSRRSGLSRLDEDSEHDILLGQTIETIKKQQLVEEKFQKERDRQSSSGSVVSNGTNSRSSINNNNNNNNSKNTEYKKRNGVQLFPRWAQAIKRIEFPRELLVRTSFRYGHVQNRHFSPPFVSGNVLTPSTLSTSRSSQQTSTPKRMHRKPWGSGRRDSGTANGNDNDEMDRSNHNGNNNINLYRIGANLWVSAYSTKAHRYPDDGNKSGSNGNCGLNKNDMIPSAASVLASNARLAIWAGVLLQHCPEDAMVVLEGARHVFRWFKERDSNSIRGGILGALARGGNNRAGYGYYYGQSLSRDCHIDWRTGGYNEEDDLARNYNCDDYDYDYDYFAFYKKQCQEYVQDVFEEAWGCKDRRVPLWGSTDDPVKSVYATTTWNGKSDDNGRGIGGGNVREPLLTFPLRIRSRRELSKRDWAEMEESVEKTILDPNNPSRFCVQAYYDRETSVSTLAANQRCVLATFIRAATLPNETVLHHLTDVDLVGRWDDASGRQVAAKIAERSHVGKGTRQIIDAMDWSNTIKELISVREAEYVVHAVMNGSLTAGIPNSPEGYFNEYDFLSPFCKSAPWGRLLSVLFAHMARLRSLPSMVLVWRVFCQELRRRWEGRESLPNMQYVPGLDPHPEDLKIQRCFSTIEPKASFSAFLNCSEPDPDDYNCLIGQKLQVFNLGIECIVAGELLENEAMEQFLGAGQVPASLNFNSEIEAPSTIPSVTSKNSRSLSIEKQLFGKKNWKKDNINDKGKENMSEKADYGPPTIDRDMDFWVMDEPTNSRAHDNNLPTNATDEMDFDYVGPPTSDLGGTDDTSLKDPYKEKSKRKKKHFVLEGLPKVWHKSNTEELDASDESVRSNATLSQAYFDAAEAGSIFSMKRGFVTLDTVLNVQDTKRRPGARCPVKEAAIASTGDQLYAPYLQRPHPLTDDVALQRRIMLAKSDEIREKKGALKGRLELAHRLQKPKLLSDMSAFKAANPKCTIDDFTKWYGNPGNPFNDYNTDDPISDELSVHSAYQESAAKKLDKASEAMRVLVSTRDFWGKSWEEAKEIPAAEQQPLFDYTSTVEMVIDYLEQLHPANLLNQVMAVNLSSAYLALASSAQATMKIGIVQLSLKRLRKKTARALKLLSRDSLGDLSQISDSLRSGTGSTIAISVTSSQFASEAAIFACEDVCNALSVTETMIARATSLLHKFPTQYKLVSDLLRFSDGSTLALTDRDGRNNFLNLVFEQQQKENKLLDPSRDKLPNPILREYVFRNLDDDNPCQLAVRFGDEVTNLDQGENEGGVILALSKSYYQNDE
eukprot:CAMPEP_0170766810 /NCGR_PEP_ID=MMETSP0733-20121128/5361_1 /TAXON_ID=186038 /ORGANISM="Fragilariopsis kerguelensis, Strain L26-C5" /LENGTH=1589 /DNA_ID=CAMNT_0011107801 /DNA_START=132 /DNA_END=4901 /DNA_ORIENTATION=+